MEGYNLNALAGSLTGFTVRALTQPFDVLKIRFQLQVERISTKNGGYYQSLPQAFRRIVSEEGVTALWSGHVPGQFLSILVTSTEFYWFHKLSSLSSTHLKWTPSIAHDMVLGSFAGAAATLVCQPLDVLRTRLASQGRTKVYKGLMHGVKHTFKNEGFSAFWRGLSPSLLLIVPQTAVSFSVYEGLKRGFKQFHDEDSPKWALMLLTPMSGAVAGCLSKTCVYPLDMVKKWFQVVGFEEARLQFGQLPPLTKHRPASVVYFVTIAALIRVFRMEGWKGLFKGWVPAMLKAGISTSLTFTFFEFYRSQMSDVDDGHLLLQ